METYDYDFLNAFNARHTPSAVHVSDNMVSAFFRKYLFQKAVSVFKWTLPDEWPLDYFLYVLYVAGYVCIYRENAYGVIPQFGTLAGYNIYYQPREVLISNQALKGVNRQLTIGRDVEVLKLTPYYYGVADLINFYADSMAATWESLGMNLTNTKLAYVFAAPDKTKAESFKKLYDTIQRGDPAAFYDKSLLNDDGSPAWMPFQQNLKQTFIGLELFETLTKIENKFDAEIGLPNNNSADKKERLIVDEVNANNVSTYAKAELWFDTIQQGIETINEKFGINITCNWRHDPADLTEKEGNDDDNDVDNGTV